MVEVFKTNIHKKTGAKKVLKVLSLHFPKTQINFDLEDVDHILRVEYDSLVLNIKKLIRIVRDTGYEIQLLEERLP